MAEVATKHQPDLAHHIRQAAAWLTASADGENSAAISYAALELRFGVERLAVHYWAVLLDRKLEENDLREIESFKRIERRIYDLAGHQRLIDRHFDFLRVVLSALNVDVPFRTPNIGQLSSYWHTCSEYCHIGWPLSTAVAEARQNAFARLTAICESIAADVNSLGWPLVKDAAFEELRRQFVAEAVTSEEVLAHLRKTGIWAKVEYPDGRPAQFIGNAIPPDGANSKR